MAKIYSAGLVAAFILAVALLVWGQALAHHGRGSHARPSPTEPVKELTKAVEENADGTWSVGFRIRPTHSDGTSSVWGLLIDQDGCHLSPISGAEMEG